MRMLVGLMLLCSLTGVLHAQNKVLTMVADNWCPFNCDPDDNQSPGFLVEIARKTFEPMGYVVDYKIVPWTRAIEEVRAGKYNMLIAASHEETPDFVFPAGPDVSCGFDVFVREGDPFVWNGVESIKDKRIGGIQDYVYSDAINAYIDEQKPTAGKKIQILRGDSALPSNIKKLLGHRIDVLFENEAVLNYQFGNMHEELADLRLPGKPHKVGTTDDKPTQCYLGFSPAIAESKLLAAKMGEVAKEMEKNGELTKLRAKYGM